MSDPSPSHNQVLELHEGDAAATSHQGHLQGAPPWGTAFLRRALIQRLAGIEDGLLVWEDAWDRSRLSFGQPDADLQARVRVLDPRFYRTLLLRGPLGVAEAYLDGHWESDRLEAVFRLMLRNRSVLQGMDGGAARVFGGLMRFLHRLRDNTVSGSRRNIAAHYDLSNRFFAAFLDGTMTYSSALYRSPDMSLEEAQIAKLDRVCQWLDLRADDHLLEIGTGWGSFAMHAAVHYGCRVTTTTISLAQYELARRRIDAAGLGDRISLLRTDYRELSGRYDKLASIEMVEAVGAPHLDGWFGHLSRLLEPEGRAVIQAITIADQSYAQALRRVDFIKRYVFPGSFIPSTTRLLTGATQGSDLRLESFEDFGPDYARTLRTWRERFAGIPTTELRAMGLDARFRRLWEYYLEYCAAGFAAGYLGVAHLAFSRPGARETAV